MSLRKQLLNLLFPPRCPFCNQPLNDAETGPLPGLPAGPLLDPRGPGRGPGQNFVRCACAGWYRGGLRDSLRRFKFSGQKGYAATYGPILAQAVQTYLPGSYDVLTWVPVSPPGGKGAGYDQAQLLAQATAQALGTEAVSLLAKTGHNAPQSSLTQGSQRRSNVAGCTPSPAGGGGRPAGAGDRRHPHHRRHPGGGRPHPSGRRRGPGGGCRPGADAGEAGHCPINCAPGLAGGPLLSVGGPVGTGAGWALPGFPPGPGGIQAF